jgi:PAS domain S-box-containing protein
MSSRTNEPAGQKSLRLRALSHITGQSDSPDARVNASGALAVLHELASSPSTAAASLTLLHELQVHQVELDIQEEELRRAVADLETALFRQVQLHDCAPAGFFLIDRSMVLCELNRMGAQMLGLQRDALIGRSIDSFLEPDSSRRLHAALARVASNATAEGCALHFAAQQGVATTAQASIGPDPAGHGFRIVCVEVRESGRSASA